MQEYLTHCALPEEHPDPGAFTAATGHRFFKEPVDTKVRGPATSEIATNGRINILKPFNYDAGL